MNTSNNNGSLTEQAHSKILSMIVSGALEPGQSVSQQILSKELGIGRTPVREAIRQLVIEGIMEQIPRYGTLVKKQELRDVIEIFEVREAMETFAVRTAVERLRAEDFENLQKLYRVIEDVAAQVEKDPSRAADKVFTSRIVEADQAFHLYLINASGNRRITKIISDTQVLARSFTGKVAQQNPEMIADAYSDHRELWQALKEKDGAAACDVIIRHIRKSRQSAVDYFERINRDGRIDMPVIPEPQG